MPEKVNRIIIDTNLWISFLISKDYNKLDEILIEQECRLLFSEELLDEFLEIVKRPKFNRYFYMTDIDNLLDTIDKYADFIDVDQTQRFVETQRTIFYFL